eukprot:GHVH01001612.1.p1 GENE.GHVH01001612.1~~GHVH01001612.1.p1  ORF type:complete len:354 (+),score=54.02 GHVH01001612.1:87-1148(+)
MKQNMQLVDYLMNGYSDSPNVQEHVSLGEDIAQFLHMDVMSKNELSDDPLETEPQSPSSEATVRLTSNVVSFFSAIIPSEVIEALFHISNEDTVLLVQVCTEIESDIILYRRRFQCEDDLWQYFIDKYRKKSASNKDNAFLAEDLSESNSLDSEVPTCEASISSLSQQIDTDADMTQLLDSNFHIIWEAFSEDSQAIESFYHWAKQYSHILSPQLKNQPPETCHGVINSHVEMFLRMIDDGLWSPTDSGLCDDLALLGVGAGTCPPSCSVEPSSRNYAHKLDSSISVVANQICKRFDIDLPAAFERVSRVALLLDIELYNYSPEDATILYEAIVQVIQTSSYHTPLLRPMTHS